MAGRVFASDERYFDLVAKQSKNFYERQEPAQGRQKLLDLVRPYRKPTKDEQPPNVCSRSDYWRLRADECRAMADTFTSEVCRDQLRRLADAYQQIASRQIAL